MAEPVFSLASMFLLFTMVLRVTPHFYCTIITYVAACFCMIGLHCVRGLIGGFVLMTMTVCLRLHMSKEERERMRVKLLWMH